MHVCVCVCLRVCVCVCVFRIWIQQWYGIHHSPIRSDIHGGGVERGATNPRLRDLASFLLFIWWFCGLTNRLVVLCIILSVTHPYQPTNQGSSGFGSVSILWSFIRSSLDICIPTCADLWSLTWCYFDQASVSLEADQHHNRIFHPNLLAFFIWARTQSFHAWIVLLFFLLHR